jgi:4-amino-4-deoxy-L-arabinose transferase-like glycosyltransferase
LRRDGSGFREHAGLWCAAAGLLTSLLFAFAVYPRIAASSGAVLDPDGYGALGWGLWKFGTFSYYPSDQPSVSRGPLYPFLIAALLRASGGWWPHIVQAAQCACFALTCLLASRIGRRLWDPRAGLIAGMLCAVHPFLVWYTSRIWIETLAMLLFTGLVAAALAFHDRPSTGRAVLLGLVLGAACLCKGTFLPFLIVLPALLLLVKPRPAPARPVLAAAAVAVLLILPWSVRNWNLTGQIIPVHGQMGFNFQTGDSFTDHFWESPWALTPLWSLSTAEATALARPVVEKGFDGWQAEVAVNSILMRASLERYAADPLFLVRKVLLQAWTFWTWSDTNVKSAVVSAMQLPLALLFLVSAAGLARGGRWRTIHAVPAVLVLLYYASHLPLLAAARYSAVLVPTMLACSAAIVPAWRPRCSAERAPRPARAVAAPAGASATGQGNSA